MTLAPLFLLDTCSIVNLTYSHEVSELFAETLRPYLSWVEVVRTELRTKTTSRPPLPNAVTALRWGNAKLGAPIQVEDGGADLLAIDQIRKSIGVDYNNSPFQHLGEATSIYYLSERGGGTLVSDDHGARSEARVRGLRAMSTVGFVSKAMTDPSKITDAVIDGYLERLRGVGGRMQVPLTASALRSGELMGWK
jgi:hypothetical protein